MPAGKAWITKPPSMISAPAGDAAYWHVYPREYGPFAANPQSKARFALVDTHAMFYAANTLVGVLWETVLRYSMPDEYGRVLLETSKLEGLSAIRLRLAKADVPLLRLGRPGLLSLFLSDSAEAVAVAALIAEPDHAKTHREVAELFQQLQDHGIAEMPMLSWPSRQHNESTVFLAYQPPLDGGWWDDVGAPIDLDSPDGHLCIHQALEDVGFQWMSGDTLATDED